MLVRSSMVFVFTIFLSYFYFISCKSSAVQSDLYLIINTNDLDSEITPHLKKIRIVANSTNPSCTNKKLVTLGAATTENVRDSFDKEENFVNIHSNNSMRLNPNCLPYAITLGYWCDDAIIYNKNIGEGLCYINEPPVTEGTTKTIKGTKVLQVSFILTAQNDWKNLKPTIPLTSSVDETMVDLNISVAVDESNDNQITKTLTLADIFNTESCLFRQKQDTDYSYLNQNYNANESTRRFYYFKTKCLDSKSIQQNTNYFSCSGSKSSLGNTHFKFPSTPALTSSRNISTQVLTSIQIGDKDTRFFNDKNLDTYLKTSNITDGFTIKVLSLPNDLSKTKEQLTWTQIKCTKK